MEKYQTIPDAIEQVSGKKVAKQNKLSVAGIALLSGAVVFGLAGMAFEDPNSSLPTFFFTVAAFLFLAGLIKLLVGRKHYVFLPTRSALKEHVLFFDVHESDALQACMEMKCFTELYSLKREKDAGVKVDAWVAGDGGFAAVQISEYIPYAYEAVTPVMCYYGDEAKALVRYLK